MYQLCLQPIIQLNGCQCLTVLVCSSFTMFLSSPCSHIHSPESRMNNTDYKLTWQYIRCGGSSCLKYVHWFFWATYCIPDLVSMAFILLASKGLVASRNIFLETSENSHQILYTGTVPKNEKSRSRPFVLLTIRSPDLLFPNFPCKCC